MVKYCGINAAILTEILIIWGFARGDSEAKICKSMTETQIIYISAVLIYPDCHTTIYNSVRNIHCVFLSMQREKSSGDYFVIQTQTTKACLNYCAVPEPRRAGSQAPAHGDLDDHK